MTLLLILASIGAVGVGLTAAYVQSDQSRRIHFVENNDLSDELGDLEIEVETTEECMVCHDDLESEEVHTVVRRGDEYRPVCEKRICLDTYDLA